MRFPSILVSALVLAVVTFLQYMAGHVDTFGLPILYAPLITLFLTTLVKLVQEWGAAQPQDGATARGDAPAQGSLASRVLFG